jgi:Gram-negative bacterial TonB protein C-terminal
MSQRVFCAAVVVAILTSTTPASAGVLQPTANWVVDYREDQCLAIRQYGSAQKPLTLGIRPAPNGATYELLVSQAHSGPDFATEQKGAVDFGNGPIKAWLLNYGSKIGRSDIYQFRISAAEMTLANVAFTVTFKPERAPNLTFALRSMPQVLKTLHDCTEDLMHYWNADGEKTGTIAKGAKGDVRSVFTADDYPPEAVQRNQQGSSQFLLLIDEKGAVAGCHVLVPSGVPVLDVMGCQVIRARARFTPALDLLGKPVRSMVTTPPVVWRVEG